MIPRAYVGSWAAGQYYVQTNYGEFQYRSFETAEAAQQFADRLNATPEHYSRAGDPFIPYAPHREPRVHILANTPTDAVPGKRAIGHTFCGKDLVLGTTWHPARHASIIAGPDICGSCASGLVKVRAKATHYLEPTHQRTACGRAVHPRLNVSPAPTQTTCRQCLQVLPTLSAPA